MFINKTSKGFTIIELIIVIAIVAVLAGIVMTSVTVYISRAKDNAVKANVAQLAKKLQIYSTENSGFPSSKTTIIPTSMTGYDYNANNSTKAFAVFGNLYTRPDKYWCVDSTGKAVQMASAPASGTYTCTESGVYTCIPACAPGQTCTGNPTGNNYCTGTAQSCGGTCANCGSYGSDDNCSPGDCCSEYSSGCYWDGAGCAGLTCSGDSEESCGGNCPGGSNDCTWGG